MIAAIINELLHFSLSLKPFFIPMSLYHLYYSNKFGHFLKYCNNSSDSNPFK